MFAAFPYIYTQILHVCVYKHIYMFYEAFHRVTASTVVLGVVGFVRMQAFGIRATGFSVQGLGSRVGRQCILMQCITRVASSKKHIFACAPPAHPHPPTRPTRPTSVKLV